MQLSVHPPFLPSAQELHQQGLLGVHTVFSFLPDAGLWPFDDGIGDFFAAMGREAVENDRLFVRDRQQLPIHLIGLKNGNRLAASSSCPMLAQTSV